ncbi:Hypothetical protein HVR_LOCUS454 [uncultured virus]|nr:Hypothetical protein HVR_LOCUS454 [uncultured virus]
MNLLLAALAVILILLLIMSVALYPISKSKDNNYLAFSPTNSISIITPNYGPDLQEYAKSWGYVINGTGTEYILYLNENVTDINLDRHLGHLINMAGNSDYIAFSGSTSFMTRNKTITTADELLKHLEKDCVISNEAIKGIVDSGYPYRTYHGTILSQQYLDDIFHNAPLTFNEMTTIIPSYIPARMESNIPTKIPKVIYQTFCTHVLPVRLSDAIRTWLDRNPEYEYRYYDDGDQREFIQKHFDTKVLKAYDRLVPGAYRADLWRYCVIYINGGVYCDVKMGAKLPLRDIIDADTDMVFTNDDPDDAIYNAFFASTPRNPLLYGVIMDSVTNIENEYYGESPLYPTGPIAMGKHIIYKMGYKDHLPIRKTTTSFGVMQVYEFKFDPIEHGRVGINGEPSIIRMRNTLNTHDQPYLLKITGVPNYGPLWVNRQVYRK